MKEKFEEFYENGSLKKRGYKNEWGKIDGYVILYDESGEEKEKLKYENGMRLGNALEGLDDESFKKILNEETDIIVDEDLEDEIPAEITLLTPKEATAYLKSDKYY